MNFECDGGKIWILHGDQLAARESYLTTLKPSSWKAEEKDQTKFACEGRAAETLPNKKRKYVRVMEEPWSSKELMVIMGVTLEHPKPIEAP